LTFIRMCMNKERDHWWNLLDPPEPGQTEGPWRRARKIGTRSTFSPALTPREYADQQYIADEKKQSFTRPVEFDLELFWEIRLAAAEKRKKKKQEISFSVI